MHIITIYNYSTTALQHYSTTALQHYSTFKSAFQVRIFSIRKGRIFGISGVFEEFDNVSEKFSFFFSKRILIIIKKTVSASKRTLNAILRHFLQGDASQNLM